jgi:putative hydrolase of the HAD superfamily
MGVAPADLTGFFDPQFAEVIDGRRSIVEALDVFLPTVGYRGSSLDFLTYWLTRDTHLNLQLIDLVRVLRASGARLFVATDQEHMRAFHLWNAVGLRHYFDDMFYAARLGVGKSAPEFYRLVDAAIGPQAEPPLFFDDSSKVVRTARAHGWEAVLYRDVGDCAGHPWVSARLGGARPLNGEANVGRQ